MVKTFFIGFLTLWISVLYSQKHARDSVSPLKPIACDCKQAVNLTIGWNTKYGPTVDTKGYGAIQEIPVKEKLSKYYFETEHNSAWYLLKINAEGELVVDIKPQDPTNDYDFLLFKYTDSNFCRDFLLRKLIPVRSNISRVSEEDSGKTGLSSNAKVEYETRGKGFAYSKSIQVKKGEQYMLVLDNVYDSGKGHTIFFHILKDYNFSGKILDDDSVPIKADISITSRSGKVVAKTVSDKTTGEYNITVPLQIADHYTLLYSGENTFFDIYAITPLPKQKDTIRYKPAVLTKLKDSATYVLKNIHFYGDSAGVLPQSFPTLEGLYAFLTIHKNMTIRIEGHLNPALGYDKGPLYAQRLSEARAKTVYDYLVNRGIQKERLSRIGFNFRYPLYPHPTDPDQEEQNRRVEIRIISLGE